MSKLLQLSIFVLGLGLFLSCGRKIDCPDFKTSILDWFPYENNDSIMFINSVNDSVLLFKINSVFVEHKTQYVTNADCGGCGDALMINEDYDEPVNNDFRIHLWLSENNVHNIVFVIRGTDFTDYTSQYIDQKDYKYQGVQFEAVRIFTQKTRGAQFYQLIIAKDYGIIGLVDNVGKCWMLEQVSLKSGKSQSVEIRNTSCG